MVPYIERMDSPLISISNQILHLRDGFKFTWSQHDQLIILVRHAEKEGGSPDCNLSEIGKARAEKLKLICNNLSITSCYSTQYKRTFQTIQPLAESKDCEIITYQTRNSNGFFQNLVENLEGNAIVVGHIITIPGMLETVSGKILPITEDDNRYNDLFLCIVQDYELNVIYRFQY